MATHKGTFVLTGANGGLGVATTSRFLASPEAKNYKGLFTVRNPVTAHGAKKAVNGSTHPAQPEIFPLDMSTLAGVRAGTEEINRRVAAGELPPIRTLVLNAAVQDCKGHTLFTEDDIESHFGVNYLANFLLVLLLLQSMEKQAGRIVIVSSWSHNPHDARNNMYIRGEEDRTVWKDPDSMAHEKVIDEKADRYGAGYRRYGRSKTLIVMFMYELQRRLASSTQLSNISILAVDPGAMPNTWLLKDASSSIRFLVDYVLGYMVSTLVWFNPNGSYRTTWKSAGDLLSASFNEKDYGEHPQALYLDGSRVAEAGPEARDQEKQKALWAASVKLAAVKAGDTVLNIQE